MNLNPWIKISLYAGVVQGLFLALLLPRIARSNVEANRMLAWLLVTASLWVMLYLNTLDQSFLPIQTHAFLDTFPFLIGPLFYFYLKKLLFFSEKPKLSTLHFLPASLHILYVLFTFRYSHEKFSFLVFSGALKTEWLIIFTALMIVIFGYWIVCVGLVVEFKKRENTVVLFKQNLRFISFFLASILMGYIICIFFSIDFFFGIKIFAFTGPNIGWIFIPVLVYFISYFAIVQPEVMKVSFNEERKQVSRINNEALAHHKSKLEEMMLQEKLYLDPLLKLNNVAEKIKLDTTRLSWLINEEYGYNFYDFINKYRIDEFIQRLENNEHKSRTLESIAYDVGFNSKTTFNKSFKKIIKQTPGEYVRQLKSSSRKTTV